MRGTKVLRLSGDVATTPLNERAMLGADGEQGEGALVEFLSSAEKQSEDCMAETLEGLLRDVFREAALGVASSLKWQAAYKLASLLRDSGRARRVAEQVLEKERSAGPARLLSRDLGPHLSRRTRSELRFALWVFKQLRLQQLAPETRLFIFFASRDVFSFDLRRGCMAVVETTCIFTSEDREWARKVSEPFEQPQQLILPSLVGKVTLKSIDGAMFPLSCEAWRLSQYVSACTSFCETSTPIMVPFPASAVERLVQYLERHAQNADDLETWDQEFCKVSQPVLFESISMSVYCQVESMTDVGCRTVANMIKGKSPEEIRATFNIKNDFTPEEEEQVRRENEWCEER